MIVSIKSKLNNSNQNKMKNKFLLIAIIFSSSSVFTQELAEKRKDCSEFYKDYCIEVREAIKESKEEESINDRDMKLDGQSKGALFSKGDTVKLVMRAFNNLEYRLTFCAEEIFGGEPVKYKIYEKDRVLIDWKSYDDSIQLVNEKKAKIEAAIQDSIYEAQEEALEEDPYYDEFSYNSFDDSYSEDTYEDDYMDDPFEPTKKRRKFKLVKKLLYDNSNDGMAPTVNFAANHNMSLMVQIIVPGNRPSSNFKLEERGCVGVLVEHSQISKTGF